MNRRLLGPIGGPIAFFLIAGLVFAGLGWVTVAALRVEKSQRESALRADREKDLRIALWRLDGRMLPALGVEDTRPFHEYRTYSADDPITLYGPACAPLLAAEIPDWMQLHFQVDPEAGWESPQVLTDDTRVSLRRNWPELPLRNASKSREQLVAALGAKFPARQVSEAFAARERAFPVHSPPASSPLSLNGVTFDDRTEWQSVPKDAAPPQLDDQLKPGAPAPVVQPPAKNDTGAEVRRADKEKDGVAAALDGIAPNRKLGEQFARDASPPLPAPEPRPAPPETNVKGDSKNANRSPDQQPSDYEKRESNKDVALREARGAAAVPFYTLPKGQNSSSNLLQNSMPQGKPTAAKPAAPGNAFVPAPGAAGGKSAGEGGPAADRFAIKGSATARDSADKKFEQFKDLPHGFAARTPQEPERSGPPLEYKRVDGESRGLFLMIENERQKEVQRRQSESFHGGRLTLNEEDAKQRKAEAAAKEKSDPKGQMAKAVPSGSLPGVPPSFAPPAPGKAGFGGGGPGGPVPSGAPAAPAVKQPAAAAAARPEGLGGAPPVVRVPVPPTPDPMPLEMLEPVDPPAPPADELAAAPQSVAVHLGALRPQWITAPDGTEVLVLVRTARVDNKKTLYQGVVLDWAKLQGVLKDEVKDLFPDANLVPVKEPNGASREQSMTALPVHLDPGAVPEPPPAGWTPLRIGLVLAWIAAAIAFAAVGLSGWSLIDLAERRIRFVSAVTHELRTPLTSLRLYLDLLLSGMVQDEAKRHEYLSTLNVESDRLHRLIDNVLDYARLERRRKGRELHAVKAADLIEQIRRTWSDRVAADGKELVVISTLPPEQDVMTDAALVQQVVGNLIDNARKYTREATDPRIWLWARIENANRVVFEVEDRGPGVPPRDQKVIFRPFRRGETADAKAGGAGLGLALSKEWAEVLGGKLTYRGAEGGIGSSFRLELPVKA